MHILQKRVRSPSKRAVVTTHVDGDLTRRSEEHTSELQSHVNLVCRLLLEKKKKKKKISITRKGETETTTNESETRAIRHTVSDTPRDETYARTCQQPTVECCKSHTDMTTLHCVARCCGQLHFHFLSHICSID